MVAVVVAMAVMVAVVAVVTVAVVKVAMVLLIFVLGHICSKTASATAIVGPAAVAITFAAPPGTSTTVTVTVTVTVTRIITVTVAVTVTAPVPVAAGSAAPFTVPVVFPPSTPAVRGASTMPLPVPSRWFHSRSPRSPRSSAVVGRGVLPVATLTPVDVRGAAVVNGGVTATGVSGGAAAFADGVGGLVRRIVPTVFVQLKHERHRRHGPLRPRHRRADVRTDKAHTNRQHTDNTH